MTENSRLGLLSRELNELMHRPDLDANRQKPAAVAACRTALDRLGIREQVAVEAISLLEENEPVDQALCERLRWEGERIENAYFDALASHNNEPSPEAQVLFSHARAMSSIIFATATGREQWSEAIYEAAMATEKPSEIIDAALTALR